MPPVYREARSTARGRHLVAAAPLQPGDVVLSQEPYAWVLYDDQSALMCDWTCRPAEALSRCSSCKIVRCVQRNNAVHAESRPISDIRRFLLEPANYWTFIICRATMSIDIELQLLHDCVHAYLQLDELNCFALNATVPLAAHGTAVDLARGSIIPCHVDRYSTKAAQRAAWAAGHKQECRALAAAPRVPPASVRLAARALWRASRSCAHQPAYVVHHI